MSEIERYNGAGMLDPVTDSWTAVVEKVALFAGQISQTEFVPNGLRGKDNGAKVAAAILTGRELGLPPMTALASIHMINGKPGISAEMMRGLVLQAGHQIQVTESTSVKVVIRGRRKDEEDWTTVEWSEQDSRRAGILSGNHVKYPRQMFAARATTELCRLLFADVIHGLRSIEELEDLGGESLDVIPDRGDAEPPKAALTRKKREAKTQPVDAAEKDAEPAEPVQRPKPGLTRRGGATSQTAAGSETGTSGTEGAPAEATDPAVPASDGSIKAARRLFEELGYDTSTRAALANEVSGRQVGKLAELTQDEATELVEVLTLRLRDPQTGEESVEQKTSDDSSPQDPEVEPAPAAPQEDPASATHAAGSGGSVDETTEPPSDEDIVEAEIVDDEGEAEPRITVLQRPKLMALFGELGVKDKAERLSILSDLTGRDIGSANELSKSESISIIDSLEQCDNRDDLEDIIRATITNREGRES